MVRRNRSLGLGRDRGRDPVRIDGVVVQPFGLQEHLVAGLVGEAHHLVLDRGAIARADPRGAAAIDSRFRQPLGDDPVRGLVGVGDAAGDLRPLDGAASGTEKGVGRLVAGLHLQPVPGDGASRRAARGVPVFSRPMREAQRRRAGR